IYQSVYCPIKTCDRHSTIDPKFRTIEGNCGKRRCNQEIKGVGRQGLGYLSPAVYERRFLEKMAA
ncbi:MAG: hypothetical protein ABWK15_08125, partial [Dissulfuribacterales bacterium]